MTKDDMFIRAATINTPRKDFLLPPQRQAAALARLYRENKIDFSSQPETYTALRHALNARSRWQVVQPAYNTILPNFSVGTALVINVSKYKILDIDNIHTPWAERPRTGLNCPVALVENRITGHRIVLVGVHIPTKSAAPDAFRDDMNHQIRDYVLDLGDIQTIVFGDFNDNIVTVKANWGTNNGFTWNASGGVDHIFSRNMLKPAYDLTLGPAGIKNIITDHDNMEIAAMHSGPERSTRRRL